MRIWIALFAACVALTLGAPPASARTVQETAIDGPIIELDIPDDWVSQFDNDGNLILVHQPAGIAFSITVAPNTGDLDTFMSAVWSIINATVDRVGDAHIDAHQGGRYRGTFTHPSSGLLTLETVAVRVGDNWVATVTLIAPPTAPQASFDLAHAVMQSARIRW